MRTVEIEVSRDARAKEAYRSVMAAQHRDIAVDLGRIADDRTGCAAAQVDALQVRVGKVDAAGNVATQHRDWLRNLKVRKVKRLRDPRSSETEPAGMHIANGIGVGDEPSDYFRADGSVGSPFFRLGNIILGTPGVVVRPHPDEVAAAGPAQHQLFGAAQRTKLLLTKF